MSERFRWYSILAALAVLFSTAGLTAQEQDPNSQGFANSARGFAADRAFQMGDFDNVNVFNGNLIVTMPLGQSFPVAGNLSYGVSLVYNSKLWPGKEKRVDQYQQEQWRATPEKISNAGFGWLVSMGRLYVGCTQQPCLPFPQQAGLNTYESPDGALHSFYAKLHETDGTSPAGVAGYTRDGTYLRLRTVSGGYEIDFPDGSIRKFVTVAGTYSTQLTEVRDAFGNKVTLSWSGSNWTFGDSRTGRADRFQNVTTVSTGIAQANLSNVISKISFTAQGGRTLDYNFIYSAVTNVLRGCLLGSPGSEWTGDDGLIPVVFLNRIEVRDAAASQNATPLQTYSFEYTPQSALCSAWTLDKMVVPTGGAVTWTFGTYSLPTSPCGEGDPDQMIGVTYRTLWSDSSCTDRTNSTCNANKVGEWTYAPSLVRNYPDNAQVNCNDANFPPRMVTATPSEMINKVTAPDGATTVHHFSIWTASPNNAPDGARRDEYGLPFGRSAFELGPNNRPRYLSMQQQDCATCSPKRATYVTYERDDPTSYLYASACNRRVAGNRTLFLDDAVGSGWRYKDVDFSSFDGLGHYRTSTATGNFTTPGDARTETTNYNPSSGVYPGPSFVLPSTWLIQMYTEQSVEEHGSAAKQTFTWESHGTLESVRALKNSATVPSAITTDSHDLLTVYCRDSIGNVTTERYFGGDKGSAASQNCTSTPVYANGEYQLNHSYSPFGPREKSWFSNTSSTIYALDQTVDDKSALPSSSRDISGLQTTYGYDILGRLISSSPPGTAWSEYVYLTPGQTYDNVTVSWPTLLLKMRGNGMPQSATPLKQQKYEFDKLGRLVRQSHLNADGKWTASETSYDALGRKVWLSEPESTGTSAPTGPLTAALKSTYTYDAFGRPKTLTAPDGATTTYTYIGEQYGDRTTAVATGTGTITSSTSKYNYDAFGRLIHVAEPSGPTTSTSPVGANVDTNYGYDVGGRLSSVEMKGAEGVVQNRIFDFDRRGLLQWEVHPESGMSTYTYDARGNVLSKRQAAASTQFDLNYTYDSAGRLLRLDGRNPSYDPNSSEQDKHQDFRTIKAFTYGDTNGSNPIDNRAGKLITAVRYNYVPTGSPYYSGSIYSMIVRVTETYSYNDAAGRKTHRTTDIDDTDSVTGGQWNRVQSVDQDMGYGDLDQPSTITYPTCINCGLPPYNPERNITPTYSQGQLTSVTDFVSSISYWPNGMRYQLLHTNNIADTQVVDGRTADSSASYARPFSMSSALYDACIAPLITTQPVGGQITGAPDVTMTVAVTPGSSPTYQWYIKSFDPGTPSTPITACTTASCSVHPSSTTYYFVAITNSCRTINSNTVRVSVNECVAPAPWPSLKVNADRTVTLTATATGTEPFTFTWYRSPDNTVMGTGAVVTVGPITATTQYYVKATNACNTSGVTSSTISAVIPLSMSTTGLVATKSGTTQITATWPAVTGAVRYHIERRNNGGGWVDLTELTPYSSTTYVDNNLALNTTYAYRVWATEDSNNYPASRSNNSNVDVATTMTFTSVTSGMAVSAAHLDQLLQGVNCVRAAAGWAAVTWSNILASNQPLPSPGTLIVPAHILATRARLNEALQALGVATGGYTDPDPSLKFIKAIHITEVQGRVQ